MLTAERGPFAGLEPPVVVACSGGTDSLALLALAAKRGLAPVAVHVDHGARPGSAAEADMVAAAASKLGTGFAAERVAVAPGPNFEARAREARYGALQRARVALGATAILTGHTRDDQAETVLLNLLRGAASAGLSGIPRHRDGDLIVRPLLELSRAQTAEICAECGLVPFEDPMNADPVHRRVWLRREVIPMLERGAARDLRAVLARQAAVLREESELLDALAANLLRAAAEPDRPAGADVPDHRARLRASALCRSPTALTRRALRLWLGAPPPSAVHLEAVLAVVEGSASKAELPGGRRVCRTSRLLTVVGEVTGLGPGEDVDVPLPGVAEGNGWRIESWVEAAAPVRWPEGRWTAVIDADRAGDRAILRGAAPGERFTPLGLARTKRIAEALRESGVPAIRRRWHPVLATPGGEVIWVLGYRIADHVRVGSDTRRFLWLCAETDTGTVAETDTERGSRG